MKRVFALVLAIVMLSGVVALAEEPVPEATPREAFCDRLAELLADFNPTGEDQATLSLADSRQEVMRLMLKGVDELLELDLQIPPEGVDAQAQFTPEEAYLAAGGSVIGFRYEDFPAIAEAAAKTVLASQGIPLDTDAIAAIDREALQAVCQLALQTAIMRHVTIDKAGDGTVLNYAASGGELIADLCEFADQVLAEEQYRPLLEQIWAIIKASSVGSELPGLDELIAMWPQAKEYLLSVETDFSLALEARVNGDRIAISAQAGVPDHLCLLDFALEFDPNKGKLTADTKLTEQVTRGSGDEAEVRNYDIQANFDLTVRDGGALWSLEFEYPIRYISLSMNGIHLDTVGRIAAKGTNIIRHPALRSFDAVLQYEKDEDGLAANLKVNGNTGIQTDLALELSERDFAFTIAQRYSRDYIMRMGGVDALRRYDLEGKTSRVIFSLKAEADENRVPQYVNIVQGDVTIHCTDEFVSDREYLITLTPEGENIADTSPAYIRVSYEGEEGDWTLRAVVIDPEGNEYASAALAISPSNPTEPLSGTEGLMMLTPELVQQLIGMMMDN